MSFIKTKEEKNIFTLTLNRPDVRNAFNPEMISELRTEFFNLSNRSDLRAIVLRGEGKSFCAGADLKWMQEMVKYDFPQNQADAEDLFSMFEAIWNCRVPVVSVVHGHAMGGALGILAASDIVLAEESTQFCFSEVRLGIIPAVISAFVLKKVSLGKALELMMSGRTFSAERAYEIGLAHFSGDITALDSYLSDLLNQFSECGPEAVRSTKKLLQQIPELSWQSTRLETTRAIAERRVSAEGQEGLKSFLEKRKPSWRSS